MVLNYIWIAFFLIAFVFGIVALLTGDMTIFQKMVDATFDSSKTAFETSLGLTGVLALWLGIMKVGEKAGIVNVLARMLSPFFTKLFPDIPKNHPVMGSIFMNIASNMLGLDNAATPTGLKAMSQMQELNTQKDTATNPMIMFLVLNTSGLTIIPTAILGFRSASGAAQPTDVFIPILLATTVATLAGIIITAAWQRINIFQPTLFLGLVGLMAFVGIIIWGFGQMDKQTMATVTSIASNLILMTIIVLFIAAGLLKKINVYDAQNGAQLHEPARVFMRNAHKQGSLVVFVSSNISKKTSKQKAEFAKYLIDEYGLAYDSNIGYFRMCENYSDFKKIVDSIKLSQSSPLLVDDSDERLGYASFLGVDYVMKKQPWNKCYEEEAVVVF